MNYIEKIIQMCHADLDLRDKLMKEGKLNDGYNSVMNKLHNKNADELKEIIDEYGFPNEESVGKEANDATWLIIQHAIAKPNFMRFCLKK